MIPQTPDNNRNFWRLIETAARDQTLERGERYLVISPVYQGSEIEAPKDQVLIPTHLYNSPGSS